MGVSKFTQPNHTTKASDQAGFEAYCGEIESSLAVLQELLGQFAPYASTPPDMKVGVGAGRYTNGLGIDSDSVTDWCPAFGVGPGTGMYLELFADGKVVAQNTGGGGQTIYYSTNGGETYTLATGSIGAPPTGSWRYLVYLSAAATWATFVSSGHTSYRTTSGLDTNWTARTAPASFVGNATDGVTVVAIKTPLSTTYYYTTDLINWTSATSPAVFKSILYAGGVFWGFPNSTGTTIYYSTNGTSGWTAVTMPFSSDWNEITYFNGVWVATSSNSIQSAAISSNKTIWAESNLGHQAAWKARSAGGTGFLLTAGPTSPALVSQDGQTWSVKSVPLFDTSYSVLDCNGNALWYTYRSATFENMQWKITLPLPPEVNYEEAAYATISAQQTASITAPTTAPRIDRIGLDALAGTLKVFTGAEAAVPVAPAYVNDVLPICQVCIAPGQTVITNAHITDERGIVNADSPQAFEIERSDSPNVIPIMTSNTAPSGVASASSEYSAVYPAWKAFDKSPGGWQTTAGTSGWLAYEFAAAQTVISYELTAFGSVPTRSPKTWTFEGWDGSGWVVLDTQANAPAWSAGERRLYEISNSTAYIKYRLNVTASGDGTYVLLAEMSMRVADTLDKTPAVFDDFTHYALLTEPGLYHIPSPPAARLWRITAVGARGGRGGGYLNGSSLMTAGGGGKGPGACLPNLLWAAEALIVVVGEAGQDGADSTPGVNNAAAGLPGENTEIIGAVSGIKATLDGGSGGAAGTSAPAGGAAGAVGSAPAAPFNVGFAGTIGTAGTTGSPGAYGNSGTCGELGQLGATDAFVLLEWC